MKFALALLAIVATATAGKIEIPNFGRGELYKDIQEFIDLVPSDEIISITLQYVSEDKEFQDMIAYFQGGEFKDMVREVERLGEIKILMDYIHNAGIDIYKLMNMLNEVLGLPRLTPPQIMSLDNYKIRGGIRGYVDDIRDILPLQKMKELYKSKLANSKAFADFVNQLKSDNFQKIVNAVYANPKFQNLLAKARAAGIDLKLIADLLRTILGITVPGGFRY